MELSYLIFQGSCNAKKIERNVTEIKNIFQNVFLEFNSFK